MRPQSPPVRIVWAGLLLAGTGRRSSSAAKLAMMLLHFKQRIGAAAGRLCSTCVQLAG